MAFCWEPRSVCPSAGRPIGTAGGTGAHAARPLAQAVLRGGRGILGEESTRSAITQTIDGFHGAEQVNLSETRRATDLLAQILQPEQASRLGRVLQSVWEGHGGNAADFPGYRELSGRMTDGDLEFLLTNVPTQSVDFWRKIGRGVEVPQIARLELPGGSPNLQALIMANTDVLQTRGVRVIFEQEGLDEADNRLILRWITARKCLALRTPRWTAYIAPTSVADLPRPSRHNGPTVRNLRNRADRSHTRIGNLELDAGDRIISYASKVGEDVLHDDRLSRLTDQSSARVRRATLALSTGSRLGCDFSSLTATGQTSAVFTVDEILKSALPILLDVDKATEVFLSRLAESQRMMPGPEQEMLEFPE